MCYKNIGLTRDDIFRDGKRAESGWTVALTHHSVLDHHELERREFFQSFLFGKIVSIFFICFSISYPIGKRKKKIRFVSG